MKRKTRSNLITWLQLSIATFLLLVFVNLALPAFFLLLQVPSFSVGDKTFQILRWRNDATGTGIQFNMIPLLVIAVIVGFVGYWIRRRRHSNI